MIYIFINILILIFYLSINFTIFIFISPFYFIFSFLIFKENLIIELLNQTNKINFGSKSNLIKKFDSVFSVPIWCIKILVCQILGSICFYRMNTFEIKAEVLANLQGL